MKSVEAYDEVSYPCSTYVWCKGEAKVLGPHVIFVSSPVRFASGPAGRSALLTCPYRSCSLYAQPARYSEEEIGLQDNYVFRGPCPESEFRH